MQLKQIFQHVSFGDVANALADMYPEEMFSETGEFLLPSYEEVFEYLTDIQPGMLKYNLDIRLDAVVVTSVATGTVVGDPQLLSWAKWMAMNVVVDMDAAENIKPTKAKSPEKIDGIVAAIMALDRCIRHENTESVYDNRGLLIL